MHCLSLLTCGEEEECIELIKNGAHKAFLRAIIKEEPELLENAIFGIGNLAISNLAIRIELVNENFLEELMLLLNNKNISLK